MHRLGQAPERWTASPDNRSDAQLGLSVVAPEQDAEPEASELDGDLASFPSLLFDERGRRRTKTRERCDVGTSREQRQRVQIEKQQWPRENRFA
jgi:hypothetical protein